MDDYFQGIAFLPFNPQLLWILAALIGLLIVSALVSGSETAFFSLSPNDIHELEESDGTQAQAALRLLDDKDRLLSTILITNNLVNIGAILAANSLIDGMVVFGGATALEFIVKVIIVTFLLLLFGEIMPKIFAAYNSLSFAQRMSVPLLSLQRLFRPLSAILIRTGGVITRALARKQSNLSVTDLTDAIEIAETDSEDDKKMLTGIVRFAATEVDQIMKPRIDVRALEIGATFADVKQTVVESGFSRIPVYHENLDDIRGILYVKDLLPHLGADASFNWQQLLRPAYFVPEHKKINDLLEDFQKRKIHIAVVVDEYGGTLGIASLEDILEEIVGEIADESDTEDDFFRQIDDHRYIFEGRTHLGDFLRVLELPDGLLDGARGDADTLAGLMLEIRGEFFCEGESVQEGDIEFKALRVENRRITEVEVTFLQPDEATDGNHDDTNEEKE
ncbi:gliding motility-associated protein GldE [uncultured Rikenella sp.]|uniref:gliding motility-associated protein GldE n=1 Tax=uncultured Rikenella sp. TaxID=368003 RepID=UPI00272C9C8A|nr:gliding motility-associated protein GldE [uncultured Rikenella sp.]